MENLSMEPDLHLLAEDELPPNPYSEPYSTTLVFSPHASGVFEASLREDLP
jgi:hypothetical protein